MSDIAERLRKAVLTNEAADEIERLRSALEAIDKRIDAMGPAAMATHGDDLRSIVRAALQSRR